MPMLMLMPAAAPSIPAVKSAQCPPGHIVSGGSGFRSTRARVARASLESRRWLILMPQMWPELNSRNQLAGSRRLSVTSTT
jgi:hypothetical protein